MHKLPKNGSQNYITLKHLALYGPLSSVDALEKYRIMRLPNRISELRHKYGFKIEQKTIYSQTQHNVKWEEYYMLPQEQQKAKELLGYA